MQASISQYLRRIKTKRGDNQLREMTIFCAQGLAHVFSFISMVHGVTEQDTEQVATQIERRLDRLDSVTYPMIWESITQDTGGFLIPLLIPKLWYNNCLISNIEVHIWSSKSSTRRSWYCIITLLQIKGQSPDGHFFNTIDNYCGPKMKTSSKIQG